MIEQEEAGGKVLYEDADHKFIWLGTESRYRKGPHTGCHHLQGYYGSARHGVVQHLHRPDRCHSGPVAGQPGRMQTG